MYSRYLLFVGICLCIARNVYAKDLTLKTGETSNAAIDETIRKIRTKCFLSADNYFLTRLATAQMMCFHNTTNGGIWRVTVAQLNTVKSGCNGALKANCSQIKTDFNVDIPTLTMSDLAKPLYSGLVMSLYIMSLNMHIPVNYEQQSTFWETHINKHCKDVDFKNSTLHLEQMSDCASAQIDLVFVIDSSGSVGSLNFLKTTEFLVNIVKYMDIGPANTRVAVVRFASTPTIMFGLGAYNTRQQVIDAIGNVTYNGGGTATSLALAMARTQVFTTKRTTAASKVLVLVTDGHSNSELQTTKEAQLLKDENVIIYTIGVVNPRVSELIAAASEPSCTHFIILKDYTEIGFIVKEILSESCKATTVVPITCNLLNNSIPQNNETKQQVLAVGNSTGSSLGITIQVTIRCGEVTVYAAINNSYPSEANYNYKITANDGNPGILYVTKQSQSDMLTVTILSKLQIGIDITACKNPSYDININPTVEVVCRQNGVVRPCSAVELRQICYNTTPSPCTLENRVKKLFRFTYPGDGNKYIQCGPNGEQTIVECPANSIFDSTMLICRRVYGNNFKFPCTREAVRKHLFYHSYPTNNRYFIQCDDHGKSFVMPCGKNTVWNNSAKVCTEAPESNKCSPAAVEDNGGYFPHTSDPNKFFQCGSGEVPVEKTCPEGTVWKQSVKYCDYP